MSKKGILISALISMLVAFTCWLQQGCIGKYPPLAAIVATATLTLTPVPTPSYPGCTNVSTPTLIDDMEDANNQVLANQCRTGYWFNYNDGTAGGVQEVAGVVPGGGSFPISGPGVGYNGTGTSLHAVEVSTNSGFTNYGAGFGFDFLQPQGNYDAFGYHGIQFYGKNTTGTVTVAIEVPDGPVIASNYAIGPHTVNEVFTTSWQLFQISMSQLTASPNSYGTATVFDPAELQQVEFQVSAGVVSDVWIDNISFY
jgi:hypothetical protein